MAILILVGTGPASGRALDGTHILAITYTSNATWTLAGSPFVIDGNVQVAAGATLTVEPGVVVKFNGTLRWLRVSGTLKAIGTATDPITFTSIQDDSIAGDTGGDGPTNGAPGQWYAIEIVAGTQSEFRDVEVRYGGNGSGDSAYGAIAISGTGTRIAIDRSDIHDNQRSGVKIFQGGATISRSTLSSNAIGVSVNMGWVALSNRTVVSMNSSDGVWFNYTSTYAGPTSTIFDSDVIVNGGNGVNLGVDRTLATAYWPHGNRNNIYDNGSKQLKLSGYHPAAGSPQYAVDWTGNYWGSSVYFWTAPTACLSASPYSAGHLAHQGSGSNPPDGPISSNTYSSGTTLCSYDRFQISASGFNTGYSQPEPTLTPEQHATVIAIAEDDARVQELLGGHAYAVTEVSPWSRIHTDLLLGADITFSWEGPASVEYSWPGIFYDYYEATNPPYTEGTTEYGVNNMTSLEVIVDLTRGLVVSIQPGPEAVLSQAPRLVQRRTHAADATSATSSLVPTRAASYPVPGDLGGYPTNRMQMICLDETCFLNYDFSKKARLRNGIRPDRVDWPVAMIFTNAADVNRIEDAMCSTNGMNYCHQGSGMWMRLRDGSGAQWAWDEHKGVKDILCPGPGKTATHMRIYADSDDQLGRFDLSLGFFVLGTTHFDHNECAPLPFFHFGNWSGKSEDAEKKIRNDLDAEYGDNNWIITPNAVNLWNAESGTRGSHRKQNNGLATKIRMPQP